MIANLRRLVILHVVLGLVSVFVYMAGPGLFAPHSHMRGPGIALVVLLKVFFAWMPYIISGLYSCNVLAARNPRATFTFICCAVSVGIVAACLNLNLFGTKWQPAPWLLFTAVTIVLIAIAWVCATIWRSEEAE
jgi:hypothetical protein